MAKKSKKESGPLTFGQIKEAETKRRAAGLEEAFLQAYADQDKAKVKQAAEAIGKITGFARAIQIFIGERWDFDKVKMDSPKRSKRLETLRIQFEELEDEAKKLIDSTSLDLNVPGITTELENAKANLEQQLTKRKGDLSGKKEEIKEDIKEKEEKGEYGFLLREEVDTSTKHLDKKLSKGERKHLESLAKRAKTADQTIEQAKKRIEEIERVLPDTEGFMAKQRLEDERTRLQEQIEAIKETQKRQYEYALGKSEEAKKEKKKPIVPSAEPIFQTTPEVKGLAMARPAIEQSQRRVAIMREFLDREEPPHRNAALVDDLPQGYPLKKQWWPPTSWFVAGVNTELKKARRDITWVTNHPLQSIGRGLTQIWNKTQGLEGVGSMSPDNLEELEDHDRQILGQLQYAREARARAGAKAAQSWLPMRWLRRMGQVAPNVMGLRHLKAGEYGKATAEVETLIADMKSPAVIKEEMLRARARLEEAKSGQQNRSWSKWAADAVVGGHEERYNLRQLEEEVKALESRYKTVTSAQLRYQKSPVHSAELEQIDKRKNDVEKQSRDEERAREKLVELQALYEEAENLCAQYGVPFDQLTWSFLRHRPGKEGMEAIAPYLYDIAEPSGPFSAERDERPNQTAFVHRLQRLNAEIFVERQYMKYAGRVDSDLLKNRREDMNAFFTALAQVDIFLSKEEHEALVAMHPNNEQADLIDNLLERAVNQLEERWQGGLIDNNTHSKISDTLFGQAGVELRERLVQYEGQIRLQIGMPYDSENPSTPEASTEQLQASLERIREAETALKEFEFSCDDQQYTKPIFEWLSQKLHDLDTPAKLANFRKPHEGSIPVAQEIFVEAFKLYAHVFEAKGALAAQDAKTFLEKLALGLGTSRMLGEYRDRFVKEAIKTDSSQSTEDFEDDKLERYRTAQANFISFFLIQQEVGSDELEKFIGISDPGVRPPFDEWGQTEIVADGAKKGDPRRKKEIIDEAIRIYNLTYNKRIHPSDKVPGTPYYYGYRALERLAESLNQSHYLENYERPPALVGTPPKPVRPPEAPPPPPAESMADRVREVEAVKTAVQTEYEAFLQSAANEQTGGDISGLTTAFGDQFGSSHGTDLFKRFAEEETGTPATKENIVAYVKAELEKIKDELIDEDDYDTLVGKLDSV